MPAAELEGPLRLDASGDVVCSYIAGVRILWPEGYYPDGDAAVLDASGARIAARGDLVHLSGGDAPDAFSGASSGACPAEITWLAFGRLR